MIIELVPRQSLPRPISALRPPNLLCDNQSITAHPDPKVASPPSIFAAMAVDHPTSSTAPPTNTTTLSTHLRTHIPISYLTLPSQWLDTYASFVRSNASQVSQLESALRSLQYIIPGRFHETPIISEFLHTFLALLTAYHTHLLPSPSPPSPGTRYQRFWEVTSSAYGRCAALLRTVQYTQLLCEMFAKRAGERVRWRVVVVSRACESGLKTMYGEG